MSNEITHPIFGTKIGELFINQQIGEGDVVIQCAFLEFDPLLQADVLNDWIGVLTSLYNDICEEAWGEGNDS